MNTTTLAYSSAQINRDFRMKVSGRSDDGKKVHTLVGVSGLLKYFGVEFANKFLSRAYKCGEDSCTCKLRRGIKVTFYWK